MTKTLFIDSIRTIKKSIVIFISIILFSMLCVALYTGLEWSTNSILRSVHESMEKANLYDIRMLYDRSLSETDLQKISEIDGVDEIVGSRLGYETFIHNGNQYVQARILEIGDFINVPQNVEGRLPQANNEVAVSKKWAGDNCVKIGETLRFLSNDTGYGSLLQNELIVTAFMDTMEYNELSVPGYGVSEQNNLAVGCILYVSKEAFNPILYSGNNLVLIKSDKLRGFSSFSDEYKTEKEKIKNNIVEALAGTELSSCVITDRTYLPTSYVPKNLTISFESAKSILVSVFLIIGLLICYSSIIRTISDQTYLIGTKMAMGIRPGTIRLQYCLYSESAILIGCLLGGFLGEIVANILLAVCSKNYAVPFVCKFDFVPLIIICSLEIILALLVTLFGVNFTLKKKIVELLNGNETITVKKHFYERLHLWKKLSLFMRMVINNFVNEKKRVIETFIGIVGSTALLMISLTMYYDINQSFNTQYSDYYKFDSFIFYDSEVKTSEKIASVLDERDIPYSNIMYARKYIIEPDGSVVNGHIVVFNDEASFQNLVKVVPDGSNNSGSTNKGTWVNTAYRNCYGEQKSDVIRFKGGNDNIEIPIDGFFKYYLTYRQLFMDSETYEAYMDEPVVNNAFMINLSEKDKNELLNALIDISGYRMFTDYYEQTYHNYSTFKGVGNMVIIVYFILAIILSFMVSLSVLNMFVKEKKRQLITMMINGYSLKKVKLYIFMDTAFITFFGIIIGLVFGSFMGIKSVCAFESSIVNFVHKIPISAIVISATVIMLIMFVLSMIAQRKIGKYKLSDINDIV